MSVDWHEIGFEFDGYEYDPEKEAHNITKHGIAFEDGYATFGDRIIARFEIRNFEERYAAIGVSGGRLLFVAFAEREGCARIISVRPATKAERNLYRSRLT